MKVNVNNFKVIGANTIYGKVIACSMYLANKIYQKEKLGNTIHEQVADLLVKGNDIITIAKTTGFEEKTVREAICDIQVCMGIKE